MSKEKVYEALAEQEGMYLSGQALSERLGISRAAVWKAVDALRRQGCDIEARTGMGYRLRPNDRLDGRTVSRCLTVPRENWHVLDEVDSTNTACKRMAADGAADGTVVMADRQTAGKGRRGRSFFSPKGKGLYLSVLWRPEMSAEALLPLTALVAVAVCRALEQLGETETRIKWPNDLVLRGRKLGGILTEMSLEGESGHVEYVVVGIGINCRQQPEDFGPELADMAISLDMAEADGVHRATLAAVLIGELDRLRREVMENPALWLEDYRHRCLTVGQTVQVLRGNSPTRARALSVDDSYGLVVRYDDGKTETLRSGEVSVRGLYGYV